MALYGPLNSGVAAGGAGVATANATSTIPLSGYVNWIYVKYNDSPPAATTDVTIATTGTTPSAPSRSLLALTDTATSGYFHPRIQAKDQTGTAISGNYEMIPIHDTVKVTIAQANNSDHVDVWMDILDTR